MDGYPHSQQQQQHSYTAAPSFPPPIRAGQKRAAEYDRDSPHHLRTPPQPPSGALPGLAAGGTGALQDSRATSSSAESTPGDAAAALVKEEDGANASASGSGKKVKGGNNPPPLKRGSACTLCRKRKLVRFSHSRPGWNALAHPADLRSDAMASGQSVVPATV